MFEQDLKLLVISHRALSAIARSAVPDRVRESLTKAVAFIEEAHGELLALDKKVAHFGEILRAPREPETDPAG